MTREQAIEHGKFQLEVFGGEHREFIKLAIEALEQEPCEDHVNTGTMVKLDDVIELTYDEPSYHDPINVLAELRDKVRELDTYEIPSELGRYRI